ncbi:putative transcriptional regulator of viral defense system [Thermocatellispora tengchongensis]|uniref:Putative transcriptional regulator of viral defense system n=1 Tax=Thermocatellispora tengchongensis TaxID=1073253 RepID=A0A840PCB4_9ACTN|nr:helix-turn-helix domain-containing protein [Thermocatellispora tengchongensis]MBB5136882.1 putative transcriptional regulator of viral defense system [Thermocatellispora tengchongensis]
MERDHDVTGWTFLTRHARALILIHRDPHIRIRDLAAAMGTTERTAHAIVTDLAADGYLTRLPTGRRITYVIDPTKSLRYPPAAPLPISALLDAFTTTAPQAITPAANPSTP